MKTRLLTLSLLSFLFCIGALAQTNCVNNTNLICLIPITTNVYAGGTTAQAQQSAAAFNGPIGAQLSQLPIAASATGLITLIDAKGNPIPYDNLGPILVDRPDTLPKGRLVLGFSYEQFNFNSLDSINLKSIPFTYSATNPPLTYIINQNENIGFKDQQYVSLLTYGITGSTDITFVVPFSQVSIGVFTSGTQYTLGPPNNMLIATQTIPQLHVPGSASGLGDISFNVKQRIYRNADGRTAISVGGIVRLATGDEKNYLGSGAYGFNFYAIASYKAAISPHARIAYQVNTSSLLVNPLGGTNRLPGGVQYDIGADARIVKPVTFSFDMLGAQFENSPYFVVGNSSLPEAPANFPTLKTVSTINYSYTTINVSAGLKWKPFKKADVVLYGNLLTQTNNVGLRSNPAPLGGISYSFNTPTHW